MVRQERCIKHIPYCVVHFFVACAGRAGSPSVAHACSENAWWLQHSRKGPCMVRVGIPHCITSCLAAALPEGAVGAVASHLCLSTFFQGSSPALMVELHGTYGNVMAC